MITHISSAGHSRLSVSTGPRIQPWLWPNVMSLDAPAIAVLWQWLLAHCLRVHLSRAEPLVLVLAVWSVYISDQIFDTLRPAAPDWAPARKIFYRRHFRTAALAGVCLVFLVLPLSYYSLDRSTFYAGAALASAVAAYFGFVHLAPAHWRASWPREAVVAAIFTLGTFLGVWIKNGCNWLPIAVPAVLFSLLCWTNCSAIETWEWQSSLHNVDGRPSASARWAARHLTAVDLGAAILAASLGVLSLAPLEFCVACFWSGIVLAILGACRSQLQVNVLRVAADAALCTPLLALIVACLR